MRSPSPVREIRQQAVTLCRGRLICELLRREGLLADNARVVINLADNLLRTYTDRTADPL